MTETTTESERGRAWSSVAQLYRKMDDPSDGEGATAVTTQMIIEAVEGVLPLRDTSFILDVGCGPGQLIGAILDSAIYAPQLPDTARFVACDISSAFVDITEARKQDRLEGGKGIWKRLEVHQWDAENLSAIQDGVVSHIVSSYAYQAVKDQKKALSEANRVLMPGGVFVIACIGKTQWGEIWKFINEVSPPADSVNVAAGNNDSPMIWHQVEGLLDILRNAGFQGIGVKEYAVSMPFDTFDEAVEWCSEAFPHTRHSLANMSESDAAAVKGRMLQFIKDNVDGEPFRLKGNALVGWGRR